VAGEKILVVDDETLVRKVIEHNLRQEGYQVISAGDGPSALELARSHKPDLIILDILLPGLDGIEVCRQVRKESDVPIIFLTAKKDSSDVILGLGVGGDDYIVKPFNHKVLIARVKASLRRAALHNTANKPGRGEEVIACRGLEINLLSRTVSVDGKPITLTNKEFELLAFLAHNPNRVLSYQRLLEHVWQFKDSTDYRTVMVHINRLRGKIEKDPSQPRYIVTVRGVGYKFNCPKAN